MSNDTSLIESPVGQVQRVEQTELAKKREAQAKRVLPNRYFVNFLHQKPGLGHVSLQVDTAKFAVDIPDTAEAEILNRHLQTLQRTGRLSFYGESVGKKEATIPIYYNSVVSTDTRVGFALIDAAVRSAHPDRITLPGNVTLTGIKTSTEELVVYKGVDNIDENRIAEAAHAEWVPVVETDAIRAELKVETTGLGPKAEGPVTGGEDALLTSLLESAQRALENGHKRKWPFESPEHAVLRIAKGDLKTLLNQVEDTNRAIQKREAEAARLQKAYYEAYKNEAGRRGTSTTPRAFGLKPITPDAVSHVAAAARDRTIPPLETTLSRAGR